MRKKESLHPGIALSNEEIKAVLNDKAIRFPKGLDAVLQIGLPMFIINADTQRLIFNHAASALFGLNHERINEAAQSFFSDSWQELEQAFYQALEGENVSCDLQIHKKFCRATFGRYTTELNHQWLTLAVCELPSARTEPESYYSQALKESEERFRQLADFMPQMVWTAKADGSLDYYNRQWLEFTGTDNPESSPYLENILHPDDVEYTQSTWSNAVKNGEAYEIAYRFRDRNQPGEYRWFLGRAFPVKDADNRVIKWFGTATDIHDTKMIAEELERRVAERTRDLNEAYNSLKRSNEELEQFAYVASHDLQEPLRKIKTFASRIIERGKDSMDETSRSYLDKLMGSADRMSILISDVLNYSMLNQLDGEFERTDLNETLQRAMNDFELSIVSKNAELKVSPLPRIEAISFQMNQLFHNLLSNALKFSIDTGRPCIEVFSEKMNARDLSELGLDKDLNYHRITIRDNGIGFSKEYADKIFVIFQRLNPRQKFSGTGIGLALCRKIVNLHKGLIYAESEEGRGASFHIILPEEQHAKFHYHAPEGMYFQAAGQY